MDTATPKDRYPSQVGYIVGTEGCERFSFYGMTSILVLYVTQYLKFADANAVAFDHVFTAAVYLAPLLGGWISDRFVGRYRTILWVSFGYVAGHATLAFWDGTGGLYAGCTLIALGAGGIKPCVSAFVGDQFSPQQAHLLDRMYGWFYFAINLGSIGGQFLIPKLLDHNGPSVAFAVPGIAMAAALVVYLLGRKGYVKLPPTGPNPNGFLKVSWAALTARRSAGQGRLEALKDRFPAEAVHGVRATLRILVVFLLISIFWALFFQYGSSWVLQAKQMDLGFGSLGTASPAQISVLNALFVLLLIPVANAFYKAKEARGRPVSALSKMTVGMFVASLSFVSAMLVQLVIDRGGHLHALWQTPQYFFISMGEVLVSVTGLEFAYTQAPKSMKSTIMGFWFVTLAAGNLLTAAVAFAKAFSWFGFYAFFAAVMFVAAVLFWGVARWYRRAVSSEQAALGTA